MGDWNHDTHQFLMHFQAWVRNRSEPWPEGDLFKAPYNDPIGKLVQVVDQERPKQWVLNILALTSSLIFLVLGVSALIWWRTAVMHSWWNSIGYLFAYLAVNTGFLFSAYYLRSWDIPTRYQLLAIAALQLFWDDWNQVDERAVGPLLEAFAYWFPRPWLPVGFQDPTIMMMLARTLPRMDHRFYDRLSRKQRWIFMFLLNGVWTGRAKRQHQSVSWWDDPNNPNRDLILEVVRCSWVSGDKAVSTLRKLASTEGYSEGSIQIVTAAQESLAKIGTHYQSNTIA